MNHLYTFNSQQLHTVSIQQSPQKHTLFRKRILIRRDSLKQSNNSQHVTQEDQLFSQRRYDRSPLQKVTFKDLNSSLYEQDSDSSPSPNQQKIKSIATPLTEIPLLPQQSLRETPVCQRKVKKCFSIIKRPETDRKTGDESSNFKKQNVSFRQKRIFSVRMRPKIVIPLSDRKLPKVFRINLAQKDFHRQVISECGNRRQEFRKRVRLSNKCQFLDENLKRRQGFEKMLQLQNKFFEKLYMPTGY